MNLQTVQAPQGDLRAFTGKLAFTIQEAQHAMGLGRSTIYQLLSQKKLRSIKVGTRTLIPTDSIVTFLDSLEQEAA